MKKFFRKYTFASLAFLAVIFLVSIIWLYVWGIGYLITIETKVENPTNGSTQSTQFDLSGASKLDYRGVLPPKSGQ